MGPFNIISPDVPHIPANAGNIWLQNFPSSVGRTVGDFLRSEPHSPDFQLFSWNNVEAGKTNQRHTQDRKKMIHCMTIYDSYLVLEAL